MDPEEEARIAEEERIQALANAAVEEPENPDPEVPVDEPQDPPVTDEEPAPETPEPETPVDEPQDPPVARVPGRAVERRISKLAQDKRDAIMAAENYRRLLIARGIDPDDPEAAPKDPPAAGEELPVRPQRSAYATQEQFEAAVNAEASRRASAAEFNKRCNVVEDAGRALGADRWAAAKRNLGMLDDDSRIPMEILEPALEADNPEQVLLHLGEDPDLAATLLDLSPTKRAVEITKLAAKLKPVPPAPKPRSAAPPPVEPIRGRSVAATASAPSDRDSDAEWLRKRNAEVAARNAAAQR